MTARRIAHRAGIRTAARIALLMTVAWLPAAPASAQLAELVSPGRLTRPHAALEGVDKCLSCHTAGQRVSAPKCLACHQPVAQRIAQKKGVHRRVTSDCVTCHVEHTGVNGELRPFDTGTFNHAAETGFALDGLHAPLKANCAACHKTRSFLTAGPTCASCHQDPHKGTLGSNCSTCHNTSAKFATARTSFDHARTVFPLTGAHSRAACSGCHKSATYARTETRSCTSCHTDVHKQRLGASCTGCHTTATWRTTTVNHDRTAFPLRGQHASVSCTGCHTGRAAQVKPPSGSCAACHADPHQGSFPQDCAACHVESSFKTITSPFDHTTTRFPLVEAHAKVACNGCHRSATNGAAAVAGGGSALSGGAASGPGAPAAATPPGRVGNSAATSPPRTAVTRVVGFRGLETTCVSCHKDVHGGELGQTCDTCHSSRTFAVTAFRHRNDRAFFADAHAKLTCAQCHAPRDATGAVVAAPARAPATTVAAAAARGPTASPLVGFTSTPTACVSCHKDVHLGQVGVSCETCHSIAAPAFALVGFSHDRTRYPLTGAHQRVACGGCHRMETRQFPGGRGTATHFTGLGTTCVSCHTDVHRGEVSASCESCHSTQTFTVRDYTHRNARALRSFFAGRHNTAACRDCHKPSAASPAGAALMSFRTTTTCVSCHTDVHRGALGPRCETCHRP